MARTPIKKPVPRRAPVASPSASKGSAGKDKLTAAPVEGAPGPVEWPVASAARAAKKAEKISVPPKTEPAPAPVTPEAAPLVEPAAAAPVEPVVAKTPIPAPAARPAAARAAKKGTFIMTDAMETAKTYAEEAKTRIQSAVSDMNEKAKVAMEKSAKAMEELSELTKGNFDAVVESSKIAAKGVEAFGQEAVEFSRKSFEKSSSTFKSFAAVKSPAEFFQLQSELLSAMLDSFAAEAAKSSETLLKLAGEVSQPISNRVAIVSEKVKALAA